MTRADEGQVPPRPLIFAPMRGRELRRLAGQQVTRVLHHGYVQGLTVVRVKLANGDVVTTYAGELHDAEQYWRATVGVPLPVGSAND